MDQFFNEVGICRLCATVKRTNMIVRSEDHDICRKLEKCCQISVQMDDGLPKHFCHECFQKLATCYEFYTKVHDSQDMLLKCFPDPANPNNLIWESSILKVSPSLTQSEEDLVNKQLTITKKSIKTSDNLPQYGWTEYQCGRMWHTECEHKTPSTVVHSKSNSCSTTIEESLKECSNCVDSRKSLGGQMIPPQSPASNQNDEYPSTTKLISQKTTDSVDLDASNFIEVVGLKDENHLDSITETGDKIIKDTEIEIKENENFEQIASESTIDEEEEYAISIMSEDEDQIELKDDLEEDNSTEILEYEEPTSAHSENVTKNTKIGGDTWECYKWKCMVCYCILPTVAQLIQHSRIYHSKKEEDITYFCQDCQKVFMRYYSFLNHVRHHHRPHLSLCCDMCSCTMDDFAQLATHRTMHNKNIKCPIVLHCNVCGKGFGNSNSLQIHKKTHLPDELKYKVSCKRCGQKFRNSTSLKMHMKYHLGIKDHVCEQCGKKFRQKTNLEVHLLSHTTDMPYECKICKKLFKRPERLMKHSLVHTDNKPFKCQFCDKEFRTKDSLQSHSRTHTGEMPFNCKYCDRPFRFRSTLLTHENTHTGVRPYSCLECNHHFTNWPNYNKHMKRRHGDPTKGNSQKKTPTSATVVSVETESTDSHRIVICDGDNSKDKMMFLYEKDTEYDEFDLYDCLNDNNSNG